MRILQELNEKMFYDSFRSDVSGVELGFKMLCGHEENCSC